MRDSLGKKKVALFPLSGQPRETKDPIREEVALSQAPWLPYTT